eukprot:6190985-Pleurochrysis_carterae.AAC.1
MHDSIKNSAAPAALGCGATYRQKLHRYTSAHDRGKVASKSTTWGGGHQTDEYKIQILPYQDGEEVNLEICFDD